MYIYIFLAQYPARELPTLLRMYIYIFPDAPPVYNTWVGDTWKDGTRMNSTCMDSTRMIGTLRLCTKMYIL